MLYNLGKDLDGRLAARMWNKLVRESTEPEPGNQDTNGILPDHILHRPEGITSQDYSTSTGLAYMSNIRPAS